MPEPTQPDPLSTIQLRRVDVRSFLPPALAERWHPDADADTRRAVLSSLHHLLGALATYLPRHLLRDLFKRPIPGRTSGEFLSGTVLFADISGFTAMSERLSALGREGAETLTTVVNDFFTTMNAIAARHGGDLMIFGGDAMLLLFDGVDHALRACHAAWSMQQAMAARFAEAKTPQGTFQLHMAAGLGSGQVFVAALGSAASMHYTVMGPALASMGRAEALAGAGRVILDEPTRVLAGGVRVEDAGEAGYARLIAEPTAVYTLPDPPILDPPPADERGQLIWLVEHLAAIAPFLPDGLLPRLLSDPTATLEGEHRPVTVLFIDFRDADALIDRLGADDPNAITPRLNAGFDAARSVVARYEGVVNKIGAGPAGPHIIALFGAPRSHEDDPERAVRAAVEIQSALQGADLSGRHPVRIGINTGFVYAANVGSHARREYTVMGDEVNLAARLMTAAEAGQIVVAASTAARIQDAFELIERDAVQVRGKAWPQRNFLVQGARIRPVAPARAAAGELLGRANEIAIGHERILAARQGRGQIIAVSGEAGVGKSRLVDTLVQHARADGFDLISSACASYGGDIPYSVWLEPVRALLELQASDSDADRRAKLQAALAAINRADDTPIVGKFLSVQMVDTAWTAGLDAQAWQRRLFDAIVALTRQRATRRPLLCAIDDAHWIDPASRELLDHLARRVDDAAIALLVAYRPEGGWSGWQGMSNAVEIALSPFDRAASEALIADLLRLEDRQLPLAVRNLMERMAVGVLSSAPPDPTAFERYWGNPFFAQERVRALIDSGVLARDAGGQWHVTRPIESIEMPDTIHGVLMSRIDRLPEAPRRVLQVSSVIGRTFDLSLLQDVYDRPDETAASLQRHLEHLADLGISRLESPASEEVAEARREDIPPSAIGHRPPASYVFRNVTTQEVAYASLRYERRRELHRHIGDFLERHATMAEDQSGLLTHHYFEGQVWDKALGYALEAGWRAQQKYANAAAAGAYRRALQAAEALSPPRILEQLAAREALGDVLSITGEYSEALHHYERARALAAADSPHLADLCRKAAEVYERRSTYDEAFNWLKRGLEYAALDSLEAARIYLVGAGLFYRQGKHDQTIDWCEKSLAIARVITDDVARRAEAHALYLLAGVYQRRGDLEPAIETAQQAVTLYLLVGDILGQSQAMNTLANTYSEKGDIKSAMQFARESLQLKERIGDVAGQAMIMLNLGDMYRSIGDLEAARHMQTQSLHIYRELRYTLAVALLQNNLATIAIAKGNWDQAAGYLDESERLFDEIGSDDFRAELIRHRAELNLGRGQVAEARALAQQAVAEAEGGDEKLEIGLSRRVLGQVYLAQNDLAGAGRELQASLNVLESVGSSLEAASTRLALAHLRWRQGQPEAARQLVAAAIETYQSVGAEALIARALGANKVAAGDPPAD